MRSLGHGNFKQNRLGGHQLGSVAYILQIKLMDNDIDSILNVEIPPSMTAALGFFILLVP
jgi:hypothetical protein